MKQVIIKLTREEALACAICLDKERKPYLWQKRALEKIDKALKIKDS